MTEVYHSNTVLGSIHETLEALVPRARQSPYNKRWWTKELTELRTEYTTRRNRITTLRRRGEDTERARNLANAARRTFHNAIEQQKQNHWNEFLDNADNVWKAAKYARKKESSTPIPDLTVGDDKVTSDLGNIAENIYKVLVHSIRVDSIDPRRAEDVAKLQEENQALHDGLKITRLSWLNRGHAPGKTHGSLIVGVATEQMANWIIRRGLVSNFAIHLAEYYSPESRLTQCFKCQAYGHVAPVCRKAESCGHCAGKHNTKDCVTQSQLKCANCGKKHAAWNHECSVRRAAKVKSMQARYTAPTRFPQRSDATIDVEEERGWTLVESKKRKLSPAATDRRRAGPGRPPAVQTPNARSQRTLSFANVFQPQARAFGSASQGASQSARSDDHVDKPADTDMDDDA
jgi:hypothetical protein